MNKPILIEYHFADEGDEWGGRVSYVFIYDHTSELGKDIEQANSEGWETEAGRRANIKMYGEWNIRDEDIVFYLREEDAPTEEKMIEELKANDIIVDHPEPTTPVIDDLPTEEAPLFEDVLDEEELEHLFAKIEDYLSDKYGYFVEGYTVDFKVNDIKWSKDRRD